MPPDVSYSYFAPLAQARARDISFFLIAVRSSLERTARVHLIKILFIIITQVRGKEHSFL